MSISFDEAHAHIVSSQIRAMWSHLLPEEGLVFPETLHHYTNAKGLQGILGSKSLWASDCHFVNDRSELIYGHNLVKDYLLKQPGKVAAALVRGEPRDAQEAQIYVTSFCEHGDLMSQWRGYSRAGDGYSMAFRFSNLCASKKVFLTKVLYAPRDQEKNLDSLLSSIVDVFSQIDLPGDQTTKLIQLAAVTVWGTAFRLKNMSFEGEQEWRLVAGLGSGYSEKFRVVHGNFVPYVEIPFEPESLVEIRQGPGAYREASVESLRRLLSAEKFDNTKVERSLIPL